MMKLIFMIDHNAGSNILTRINQDYILMNHNYFFGELSKMNVFIGENNSGKSRFLRYLFKTNFHSLSDENFKQFINEIDKIISSKKCINAVYDTNYAESLSNIEKFNKICGKINSDPKSYVYIKDQFFLTLTRICEDNTLNKKFYFPIIRGTKDYKTIINNKLDTFLRSADSIQNKDAINHYISLLNLQSDGLESFDIYNDIIVHEYFNDNKKIGENILTGGKLYNEIKSMLLGKEEKRKVIEEFQKFLQENFFSSYDKVQLIPDEEEKVLYVKIGSDEKVYMTGAMVHNS